MAAYISLAKRTEQGLVHIREFPERVAQLRALAEKTDIRVSGVWLTMGEYDAVLVYDAPDDRTMTAFSLAIESMGNGIQQTMRAFTEEEFARVVSKLP